MNWLLKRAKEPSTWRGLVWLLTVAGMTLSPDQIEAVVMAGMALAGLLGVFLPEKTDALPPIDWQSVPGAVDRLRVDVPAQRPSESDRWNG